MEQTRKLLLLAETDSKAFDVPLVSPHPSPLTPHPSPLTPHPSRFTLHASRFTLHASPLTPHPSPLTPHPSSLTLHPSGGRVGGRRGRHARPFRVGGVCALRRPPRGRGAARERPWWRRRLPGAGLRRAARGEARRAPAVERGGVLERAPQLGKPGLLGWTRRVLGCSTHCRRAPEPAQTPRGAANS
jgi:hypothetical protein